MLAGAFISLATVAVIPRNVSLDYNDHQLLFWLSSAITIFFLYVSITYSGSIFSAQSLIGVVWVARFFVPYFFTFTSDNYILNMVGMRFPGQFQIAMLIINAAVIAICSTSVFFGKAYGVPQPRYKISWAELSASSLIFFALGIAGIVAFLVINIGSLEAAAVEGEMRGTIVNKGTGVLWYTGLAVIPASISYLYCQFRRTGRIKFAYMMPAVLAFLALAMLGGRVRALMPLAAMAILFFRLKGYDRPSTRGLVVVAVALVMLLIYLPIGATYRAGGLSGVASLSPGDFLKYAQWSIAGELGQLHGPYIPLAFGEGSFGGRTYLGLAWPIPDLLGMELGNTGVEVRDLAVGASTYSKKWAFHATMIGDAVLNFGRWSIPPIFLTFGLVLSFVQSGKMRMPLALPLSIVVTLGLVRAFSEETGKIPETYVYILFGILIVYVGRLIDRSGNMRPQGAGRRERSQA